MFPTTKQKLAHACRRSLPLWFIYERWRSRLFLRAYRLRRERYARASAPAPRPLPSVKAPKAEGDIHTFAVIPLVGWHDSLLPDLEKLGPVTHFDYAAGTTSAAMNRYDKTFYAWRTRINQELIEAFRKAHLERPVDWLFAYAQGNHLLASTIEHLRSTYGVPTVNMCLDDKNSWNYGSIGGVTNGSQALASAFDLWWTSSRLTVDWVNIEGGHAIYMPEGFTSDYYPEELRQYDIPVSFAGGINAKRHEMIRYLREHRIPVQTFGGGWSPTSSVSKAEMIDIFRRSQINLGHGGAFSSETVTNVKGRDFEVTPAGGGLYLTTFNPDLATHFRIGEEICCWHSYDDLLEQVRYHLARPEECRAMAARARRRAFSEHTWLHRYQHILSYTGMITTARATPHIT